jgi:hypothetical protein
MRRVVFTACRISLARIRIKVVVLIVDFDHVETEVDDIDILVRMGFT